MIPKFLPNGPISDTRQRVSWKITTEPEGPSPWLPLTNAKSKVRPETAKQRARRETTLAETTQQVNTMIGEYFNLHSFSIDTERASDDADEQIIDITSADGQIEHANGQSERKIELAERQIEHADGQIEHANGQSERQIELAEGQIERADGQQIIDITSADGQIEHADGQSERKLNLPKVKLSTPTGKLSTPTGSPKGKLNLPKGKLSAPTGNLSLLTITPKGKLN
jgi:hypothetical protein